MRALENSTTSETRTFVIIYRVAGVAAATFDRVDAKRLDTNVFIETFDVISLTKKCIRNGG
jgi:hypothetical protein